MLHANGLLSQLSHHRCSVIDLLLEMDRILRPEVILFSSDPSISHVLYIAEENSPYILTVFLIIISLPGMDCTL